MNPYEKYYLRQKIVTGAIALGAVALVGGGLLLWQPWNASNNNDTPDPPPVEDMPLVEDEVKPDLTITVGGKKVTTAPIDLSLMDWTTMTVVHQGATVEAIVDGYFSESTFRSAPYFALRIDGITEQAARVTK